MKIYTRKGDNGTTQLLGGTKVSKSHLRLDCYGTIDELNAFIGNIYDNTSNITHKTHLLKIQNQLFNLGSLVAFDGKKDIDLPKIIEEDILMIEDEINLIEKTLPKLTSFILPSGHPIVSKCHIARTVCRRAERTMVALSEISSVSPTHIKYLNRLSDYLFVLSRAFIKENNSEEIKWKKKQN